MAPDITVIVPYYNERETISYTLDQVASQTLPATRALFVNSSSTDDTSTLIDAWIAERQPGLVTKFENIFILRYRRRDIYLVWIGKHHYYYDSYYIFCSMRKSCNSYFIMWRQRINPMC